MRYSVSDFLNTYQTGLRCVAGSGGLSRPVAEVVLLDYELVPGLKNSYQRMNFGADQLVLTSFLYARDNPYLITEAIKYLVAQGTSGLAIRNVFHLSLPEQAIRYANARNFPVFLVIDDTLYFDRMIFEINQRAAEFASATYISKTIDALLMRIDDKEAAGKLARELNPSLKPELCAVFLALADPPTPSELAEMEHAYYASELSASENIFACYQDGIIMVFSSESVQDVDAQELARAIESSTLYASFADALCGCGVSAHHFGYGDLGVAIQEALQAARLSRHATGAPCFYSELGMLRTVLPFIGDAHLLRFSQEILDPLREHDSEHGTNLENTLRSFTAHGRSVDATARALGQHANTVRYRLERVAVLTGLDFRRTDDADQLAMACRIALANELFQ